MRDHNSEKDFQTCFLFGLPSLPPPLDNVLHCSFNAAAAATVKILLPFIFSIGVWLWVAFKLCRKSTRLSSPEQKMIIVIREIELASFYIFECFRNVKINPFLKTFLKKVKFETVWLHLGNSKISKVSKKVGSFVVQQQIKF